MKLPPTRRWIVAALATTVLAACGTNAMRESTGEYIDDSVITSKVKAKFVNNPDVRARSINVETFKGNVQLSGFAVTETEKERAVELARTVPGVKTVHDGIVVK